ncbi:MAG: type VI secretion system baseplate subunit TssE [Myxococcales bacterium]|jgi:type VI secretion system protein
MRGLLSRIGSRQTRSDPLASIASHLAELLNARQGLSATVPDYGVVDFNDVVHTLPDGVRVLQQSIRQTILEHEPRLEHVRVRHVAMPDSTSLHFEITGRLADGSREVIRVHTELRAGGHYVVS